MSLDTPGNTNHQSPAFFPPKAAGVQLSFQLKFNSSAYIPELMSAFYSHIHYEVIRFITNHLRTLDYHCRQTLQTPSGRASAILPFSTLRAFQVRVRRLA